jgi:hypothetical protein
LKVQGGNLDFSEIGGGHEDFFRNWAGNGLSSVCHQPAAKACEASRLGPASLVGPRGLVNKKGTTVRVSLTHCLPLPPPPPGEVVRVALPPPPVEWPAGWPVSFSTSTSRRLVPSPYSSPSSWCLPPVRRVTPAVGRWPPCSSRRRSPTATNPRVAGLDRDAVEGGWCSGRRCRHQRCGLWSASDCEKQRCSTASRNGPERQAVVEAWRVRRG